MLQDFGRSRRRCNLRRFQPSKGYLGFVINGWHCTSLGSPSQPMRRRPCNSSKSSAVCKGQRRTFANRIRQWNHKTMGPLDDTTFTFIPQHSQLYFKPIRQLLFTDARRIATISMQLLRRNLRRPSRWSHRTSLWKFHSSKSQSMQNIMKIKLIWHSTPFKVSGANDKTMKQWDLETQQCVLTLDVMWATNSTASSSKLHTQVPLGQWSLDGLYDYLEMSENYIGALQFWNFALASGTIDGKIRMWDRKLDFIHEFGCIHW